MGDECHGQSGCGLIYPDGVKLKKSGGYLMGEPVQGAFKGTPVPVWLSVLDFPCVPP